jgi:hypothetical protein
VREALCFSHLAGRPRSILRRRRFLVKERIIATIATIVAMKADAS